jgi:hypothetical protein
MSENFAMNWAYGCLAATAFLSVIWMGFRLPMPPAGWCLAIGGLHGAVIVGPIVILAIQRSRL